MKKVRIFDRTDAARLESIINDFVKAYSVVDIQYRTAATPNWVHHSVMIVYEED